MNLRPIAQLLEDAGLGALGSTIFINQMPMECQEGFLLRNPLPGGTEIDHELPGFFKGRFRIIARSQGFERGDQMISEACAALTMYERQVDESLFVKHMRPCTLPVVFPLSRGNLLETTAEMDVVFCL